MANWNPFEHHRGPFRLTVARSRPAPKKRQYPVETERLTGLSTAEDVEAEAKALLADPLDSIDVVYVWSEPEQKHVMTFRKEKAS